VRKKARYQDPRPADLEHRRRPRQSSNGDRWWECGEGSTASAAADRLPWPRSATR